MVAVTTISPAASPSLHRILGSSPFTRKVPRLRLKIYGDSITILFDCKQSTVVNGLCLLCNRRMDDRYGGVAFDYVFEGLRLSLDEIAPQKVTNSERVFGQKKLHLVLDLDHTLLHTIAFKKLKPNELYLKKQTDSDTSNGCLFVSNDQDLVKLRPFVRTFLEEASSMFEIYICSMGKRHYVKKIAEFLHPKDKYFDTRLIAREDFGQITKKNLNLVLGQERGIVIIDDTQSVWSDHLNNLITVKKYDYFTGHNYRYKSHAEIKAENEGELVKVLERIHRLFFDGPTDVKDVRNLGF